ncbi:hypothetical protein ACVJMZ_003030 [Sinorhizobium medicae]
MAAGKHKRIDASRALARNDRMAGQWIGSAGGKKQPRSGKLAAGHGECAVMKIDAEHMFDRMIKAAK